MGQTEVHHLHEVAAAPQRLEDDVLRLQIAVHDAQIVRFTQGRQGLAQHLDDAREGQRALLVGDAREILAAQELHHQVGLPVVGTTEVEHGDRVGMVELARGARFGHEAQRGVLVGQQMRVDDLDRDGATRARLARRDTRAPSRRR